MIVNMDIVSKIKIIMLNLFQILYWYLEAIFRQFVPPSMKSIDGEVILVTGAAGGIGKELCRYIVQCGTNIKLVMWDLNISDLYKLAGELKLIGGSDLEIFCYEVDISKRENIDACSKLVEEEVGSVTIIFNNAGIAPYGNFLQLSNEQIENTIQVNLMSHFWIIRQFLPNMVTNNHGRIINVCSIGGLWGGTHAFPYFSSKFGVQGYSESLKVELALLKINGIHVTTAYPNFVKTPLIDSLTFTENTSWAPKSIQVFLEPREVAVKIVDGMRREYERIYIPSIIPFLQLFENFGPNKLRKHVFMTHARSFMFKNAEEQSIFKAPFRPKTNKNVNLCVKTKELTKKRG